MWNSECMNIIFFSLTRIEQIENFNYKINSIIIKWIYISIWNITEKIYVIILSDRDSLETRRIVKKMWMSDYYHEKYHFIFMSISGKRKCEKNVYIYEYR